MARLLSHIASVIRGSVGGITYLSNQYHQIVARARTSPVNPMTTRQAQIRGAFSDASSMYEALNDAGRQAWSDYAATLEYQGPLGPYTVPGRQVCISNVGTARYLDDRGIIVGTPTAIAPITPGFLSLADLAVVVLAAPGTGFGITLRNNNLEPCVAFFERSIAFPPTRYRFKGPFLTETLSSIALPAGAGATLYITGLAAGAAYFVKIRAISSLPSYRISQEYIVRGVATTIPI